MSDGLKHYIDRKRDEVDIYPFDVDKGWEELSQNLGKKKERNNRWIWMSIAASVVIILVGWLGLKSTNFDENGIYTNELMETHSYYQELIDTKLLRVTQQIDDPDLLRDIEALDQAFNELSQDLNDGIHNEEVVTAMIDNYRLKLKILERILNELEGEKNEENIIL